RNCSLRRGNRQPNRVMFASIRPTRQRGRQTSSVSRRPYPNWRISSFLGAHRTSRVTAAAWCLSGFLACSQTCGQNRMSKMLGDCRGDRFPVLGTDRLAQSDSFLVRRQIGHAVWTLRQTIFELPALRWGQIAAEILHEEVDQVPTVQSDPPRPQEFLIRRWV